MDEQKLKQLEKDVAELKAWKEARTKQQITFPLDTDSFKVLNKHFLTIMYPIYWVFSDGSRTTNLALKQGEKQYLLDLLYQSFTTFSVSVSANTLTVEKDPMGGYANDDVIYLSSTITLPTPLSSNQAYYVVNASGNTFQVSLTQGGAAIDITDSGSGVHYAVRLTI